MSLIAKEIGELLVDNGLLTPAQLEVAEQEKMNTGETISRVLIRLELANEHQIADALELYYGVTYVSLAKLLSKSETVNLLPESIIRQHQVLPIDYQDKRLTLAMVNPGDPLAVVVVRNHIEIEHLKYVVCLEDDFDLFVDGFFTPIEHEQTEKEESIDRTVHPEQNGSTINGAGDLGDLLLSAGLLDDDQLFNALKIGLKEKKGLAEIVIKMGLVSSMELDNLIARVKAKILPEASHDSVAPDDIDFLKLVRQAQDASISLVANHITLTAVEMRCSDIQIHGDAENLVVQYFAHSNIIHENRLEKQLLPGLVACYKDIAGLNPGETRHPQDKRIRTHLADTEIELRITTIPEDSEEMVAITLKYLP